MKQTYIKYTNLGANLGKNFNIYPNTGSITPNELPTSLLLSGVTISIDNNASKVFLIPQSHELITNSGKIFTGLNFNKDLNKTGVYLSQDDLYVIYNSKFNIPSGTGLNYRQPSGWGLAKYEDYLTKTPIAFLITGAGNSSINGKYFRIDETANDYEIYSKNGVEDSISGRILLKRGYTYDEIYLSGISGNTGTWILSTEFDFNNYYYLTGDYQVSGLNSGNWLSSGTGGAAPKFIAIYSDTINESTNITGLYKNIYTSGDIFNLANTSSKLYVYNTPGVSSFAGDYTSGIYRINGISRTGFRNNQNYSFYIYKNTSPNEWRAVEELYNSSFIWYKNLNASSFAPPVTGWTFGDGVNEKYAPTPETNFGTCPGNTLLTQYYVFDLHSFDKNIDGIKLYSGGILNNDGTSNVFPEGVTLKDLFPGIQTNILLKNFYYSEYKNQNKYFLFRSWDNWLIADLLSNYNNPGYSYWQAEYYSNTPDDSEISTATGTYFPNGTNAYGLENIVVNLNPYISNDDYYYNDNLNLNNYSGSIYIRQNAREELSYSDVYIQTGNGFIKTTSKNNLKQMNITGYFQTGNFSGNFYTGFGTGTNNYYIKLDERSFVQITATGSGTGNFIEWFSAPYYTGPYNKFNLISQNTPTGRLQMLSNPSLQIATGYLPYSDRFLIFSGNNSGQSGNINITIAGTNGYISGTTTVNNIKIDNLDGFYDYNVNQQSGQYSGLKCIMGYDYIFATPEFEISGAKSLSSGTSIWSILDSDFNYTKWKNFESDPSKMPFRYWMSGSGMYENMLDLQYIPLYSYDNFIKDERGIETNYLLNINTGYNYPAIWESNSSGFFNLKTGDKFIFSGLFNDPSLTGTVTYTYNSDYIMGTLNVPELQNNDFMGYKYGVFSIINIYYGNKSIQYSISTSGTKSKLYKYIN